MTKMRGLKGRPKHYFKSLLETFPYYLPRLPHLQLVSQIVPTQIDSPVFDYLSKKSIVQF